MYKILNNYAAPGLKEYFRKSIVSQSTYHLRNSETDLTLPKPRIVFLKKSFKYSRAKLWNDLPQKAKLVDKVDPFERKIRQM